VPLHLNFPLLDESQVEVMVLTSSHSRGRDTRIRSSANILPRLEFLAIAERWRPYRMWVNVLLHVWTSEAANMSQQGFPHGHAA